MRRNLRVATWAVTSLMLVTGCNGAEQSSTTPASTTSSSATPAASASTATGAGPSGGTSTARVAITVSIGGHRWPARLNDSQAARALASRLPLTLSFRDFAQGFDEKVSDLDQALPFDQMSAGDDPSPGDIAYWSPDQRLVFYWGDVSRYDGIHVIGAFDDQDATSAV